MPQHPDPSAAFAELQAQIDALHERAPAAIRAGHLNIGNALWLSCDPEGRAEMSCAPAQHGFRLEWKAADSGGWAALGLGLPPSVLARGRYLGFLIDAVADNPVSFTPCLRYHFHEGGMQDVGTPDPVLLPSGPRIHLAHIPIDAALIGRSRGAEANLFFHSDTARLTINRLELLLMT